MGDYIFRPEVTVEEWGEEIVALHSNGGIDAVREIMPLKTFNALFSKPVADIEILDAIRNVLDHHNGILSDYFLTTDQAMVEIEKILGGLQQ